MKKIAYAGTFDPMTDGHLAVIKEASELANEVVVYIAENSNKTTYLPLEVRVEAVKAILKSQKIKSRVEVVNKEYVAVYAKEQGIDYMIRGIRNTIDFDYENILQKTNAEFLGGAKTLFVMPTTKLEMVSSSYIKSLMGPVCWHYKIKKFLPQHSYEAMIIQWLKNYLAKNISAEIFIHLDKKNIVSEICQAYFEKFRQYHNLEHIIHSLTVLDKFLTVNKLEVFEKDLMILAILFHDFIYKAKQEKSDETLSAEFAHTFCEGILNEEMNDRLHLLIECTNHMLSENKHDALKNLLLSIDLAILAEDNKIYKKYAKNIRREYSEYDDKAYQEGRKLVLNKLIEKAKAETLFEHPKFKKCNQKALKNMQKELLSLV
jgi:pantetheine-phosphate adenylyltransferase